MFSGACGPWVGGAGFVPVRESRCQLGALGFAVRGDPAAGVCSVALALQAPTGTVTLLFTDIESSTRMWEDYPGEMNAALLAHPTRAKAPNTTPTDVTA